MRRSLIALLLAGTGTIAGVNACSSFDEAASPPTPSEGGASEAGVVDGSGSVEAGDTGVDASAPCDPAAPFGVPLIVGTLQSLPRHVLSVRPFRGGAYFASDRDTDGGQDLLNVDLFEAKGSGDTFSDIVRLAALSDPDTGDLAPTETADRTTIFFARGNEGERRLMTSTRASSAELYPPADPLENPRIVPGATDENDPYIVGTQLYFTSRSSSGELRIYEADLRVRPLVATAVMGLPGGKQRYPVVDEAQSELYYVAYNGSAFAGVFRAKRAPGAIAFESPEQQTQLDVKNAENVNVTGLSPDGCDLYLAVRLNGAGGFAPYRARRLPKTVPDGG